MYRFLTGLVLAVCVVGCGDGSSGSDGGEVFPPGPICTAFCEKGVDECQLLPFVSSEICVQGCESDLALAEDFSAECVDAFEDGFFCASQLGCPAFSDWINQEPPTRFPCRDEVLVIEVDCEL